MSRLNIPLALPLILFLASALAGVAIAYAPKPAVWDFLFYAAGIALYVVVWWKRADETFLTTLVVLSGIVGAALVAGSRITTMQANNLAGILALAIPLNAALAVHWVKQNAKGKAFALGALLLFLLFGLALTGSRGAWLALAFVGVFLLVGYFVWGGRVRRTAVMMPVFVIAVCAIVLVSVWVLNSFPEWSRYITRFLGASDNEIPRPVLYRQVWRLIQDYFFTGSGLATFPMVYATYALQAHVYILPHAHNLWLQIWMEQGLPGVIAFGWFAASFYEWVWKKRAALNWLALGGLAATTAMLVHGLFDAAFWYNDVTRMFLFLPFAFTVAGIGSAPAWKRDLKIGAAIGAAALLALVLYWNAAQTRWYANAGSLKQTRIELQAYAFPHMLVEYVRHDGDLSDAESYFRQTLEHDAQDVTANQRLAMILLARGQYESALALAQAAYQRDAENSVTWQLLGDAYLALGRAEQAYTFWSRVSNAAHLLNVEAAIRFERNGDRERALRTRELAGRVP